jgi:AraC-like DNA-binding protein
MEMRVDTVASGAGWRVQKFVCSAGPQHRRFEEQHASVCIAAVLQGSFQYRTTQGAATLVPGALLLGNPGHCFECGHDHASGDHCLSFHFDPDCFEAIVAAIPGIRTATFTVARVPPLIALTPVVAAAELACFAADPACLEEVAFDLAGSVATLLADRPETRHLPTNRDERRIAGALQRIEAQADQQLSLAALARDAAMSRYHFLRTFHCVVGLTPHQFLLRTRLHRAAVELRRSARPVLDIALEAGFGDLSTFNRRFRATMGATPSHYRRVR